MGLYTPLGLTRNVPKRLPGHNQSTKSWTWVATFSHEHVRVEISGVFLAVVLWQHPTQTPRLTSGLAIYAVRGLRSGSAEITAVSFTAAVFIFQKNKHCRNWTSSRWFQMRVGGGNNRVQKKSVRMRKFKLRELNAENCVVCVLCSDFQGKTLCGRKRKQK